MNTNNSPNASTSNRWLSPQASRRAVAGGALAALLALLANVPEAREWTLRLALQWGPGLVLGGALLYLVHLHAPRFIAAQTDTALALQNVARAVEQLVERDSAFQREQDVLLNHVARRVEALFPALEDLERRLNGARTNPRAPQRQRKPKRTPKPDGQLP